MVEILAVVVGILYGAGAFMMLRRSTVQVLIGLSLLGHAANLLLFTVSAPRFGAPPILGDALTGPPALISDPVPQALVLTAIVIGLGVTAFAVVLVHSAYRELGSDDVDELGSGER